MNVEAGNQSISKLNIQPLICAITTMRAFEDNIILHQSLGMPIVTILSTIEAYTLNQGNKMNSCNNTCPDAPHQPNNSGSKPITPNGDKAPCTSAGDKRNTMTSKSGSKPSPVQRQKKQHLVVTNNTVKCAPSDMGMFWLSNPKMKMNEIFHCDLHEKVCIQFCCRGQECKRELGSNFPFLYPHSSEDLKLETIKLIGDHFLACHSPIILRTVQGYFWRAQQRSDIIHVVRPDC
jgi:hypothetical protein